MRGIKESLVSGTQKLMPDAYWYKLWAHYTKNNHKYDKDRYKIAYILSSRRSKKKYWIIRYSVPFKGLLAIGLQFLFAQEWAEKNKVILVVDVEYEHAYQKNLLGTRNIWEYVFKNPLPIKEVLNEKNVFVGHLDAFYATLPMEKELAVLNEKGFYFKQNEDGWKERYEKLYYYSKKYWQFQDDVLEQYTKTFSKLFQPNMKILGVPLREEFSMDKEIIAGTALERHPHHPKLDELIEIIKEYKEKWNCTHIYVTTYIQDSIEILQKEFGDIVLFTNRERVPYEKFKLARKEGELYYKRTPQELYTWFHSEEEFAQIMNMYDRSSVISYVEEIYGLSLCNCLLSPGRSSGPFTAFIWNGGKYDEFAMLDDKSD